MSGLRVATWNVLHWVHGRNRKENLSTFPTEEQRARAVVDRIAKIDADAICLQEVSGDVLELLVARFGEARVHRFRLPRLPQLRQGTSVLRDGSENLVILATGVMEYAQAFDTDCGKKGFLAVKGPGDTLVISTHVSGAADEGRLQLEFLDDWTSRQPWPVILCGDFNRDATQTLQSFRPGWSVAVVRSELKISRPASKQLIDHALTRSVTRPAFAVIEASDGMSDHNIVIAATE